MTATHVPIATDAPAEPRRRSGRRLPGSRGGLAWLAVLLIIGALLAVQFGRQVYMNWEIGQRAEAMAAEIAAIEDQNARLASELAYLESDAFISAEARRLANVGAPGEQVLIIPPGAETPLPRDLSSIEPPKPLLQQWLELFFGPQS